MKISSNYATSKAVPTILSPLMPAQLTTKLISTQLTGVVQNRNEHLHAQAVLIRFERTHMFIA